MNADQILSRANLDSLGCDGFIPFNGDYKDYSGNTNDGANNGSTFEHGINGKEFVHFDGSNDYVSFGNNFQVGTGDGTWFGWFKIPSIQDITLMHKRYDFGSPVRWAFFLRVKSDGHLECLFRDETLYQLGDVGVSDINETDTWYNWCVTRVGTTAYMYLNGVQVDNVSVGTANFSTSSVNFEIGRQGTMYGNSDQANFMFFNTGISVGNIRKLYNATYIE